MSVWVRRLLPTITILTTLPLLLPTASFGQTCNPNALNQAIEQLSDDQKRGDAQQILEQCGEASIKPLAFALSADTATIRFYAVETLGQIGWEAKSAVPELVLVGQGDSDLQVRSKAIRALSAIGRDSQVFSNQLRSWQTREIQELQALQQQLDQLLIALKQDKKDWATKASDLDTLQRTNNALQTQLRDLTDRPTYQVVSWVQTHPWIAEAGLLGFVLVIGYGGIFWLKPIWLLKLGDGLVKAIASIPAVGTFLSGLLQSLLLLKYHPHVLDAWVAQHISNVRKNLLQRPTIQRHEIHIAQPVFLQDSSNPVDFKPENFADLFKGKFRLLIWGEGGAGKTSLACQFADWAMWGKTGEKQPDRDDRKLVKKLCQHRMIPVLIEEKLGEKSFLDAIGAQLKELTEADEISNELLQKLLQERRVLVIVDHLSEITDEATHQKIRPSQDTNYPVNALIVTSRDRNVLGAEAVTVVQPSRITTENLAEFLNQYLPEKQKREGVTLTFNPDDYADAYKDLGNMISLRQAAETDRRQPLGTTILLVTLYADQMIVEKQKREKLGEHYFTTQQNLANNVPDLMLNYLDALNNKDASQVFPGGLTQPEEQTRKLHQIAQLIAWKCLEKNYKPEAASLEDREGRDGVVKSLTDLESKFNAENLEELAKQDLEYLKRLSLIQFQSNDRTLRLSLDPLAEYLAALHKFWEYQSDQTAWMRFLEQIETTVNPHDVRGFLLALYDCCDKKGRGTPLQIPEEVLKKLVELTQLDQAKIDTYYRQRRMRLALEDSKELNPTYQLRAIEDLATIAREDQTLNQSAVRCLTEMLNDERRLGWVRREAGKALRQLGEPIPLLVPEIRGGIEYLHLITPPPEQIVNLSDTVTLELVQIPPGEFWMGSEEGEGDINERPRHKVKVAGFWIGRYPVTQAQWRVVASWGEVETDLNPEALPLRGDDYPVEGIFWQEAIEFCARISRFTGQTYRLPSEAEWEYACRAGTETSYHFGKTITKDLANFGGHNTPNQATPVGQYGVANRFGLYDMHGNVWEWCADYWHGNYEGAPINSSSWTRGGNERRRALRGGSWDFVPENCRSASRYFGHSSLVRSPGCGFRVIWVPA